MTQYVRRISEQDMEALAQQGITLDAQGCWTRDSVVGVVREILMAKRGELADLKAQLIPLKEGEDPETVKGYFEVSDMLSAASDDYEDFISVAGICRAKSCYNYVKWVDSRLCEEHFVAGRDWLKNLSYRENNEGENQ